MNTRLNIVGCGLSGLCIATQLPELAKELLLIDKARGPGGRLCTRRFEDKRLDHGAVALFAKEEPFKSQLISWHKEGVLLDYYKKDGTQYYCANSGISALPKQLAKNFNTELQQRVIKISTSNEGLTLHSESGKTYSSKALVLTSPAPQTIELLANSPDIDTKQIEQDLAGVKYEKCLAALVLANFDFKLEGSQSQDNSGIIFEPNSNIKKVFDNQLKQRKTGLPALTFHFSEEFSDEHFELPQEKRDAVVNQEVEKFLGSKDYQIQTHRWRYSTIKNTPFEKPVVIDAQHPIILAGEAFSNVGVQAEAAWNSGLAAVKIVQSILSLT